MVDYLGWAATAVFVSSYFCTSAHAIRRVQMIGAVMWMAYAVVMHAAPVFVANLLVLGRGSLDDSARVSGPHHDTGRVALRILVIYQWRVEADLEEVRRRRSS